MLLLFDKVKSAPPAPVLMLSPGNTAAPLFTATPESSVASPNVVSEPAGIVAAMRHGTSSIVRVHLLAFMDHSFRSIRFVAISVLWPNSSLWIGQTPVKAKIGLSA